MSKRKSTKHDCTVCGRAIGRISGWDQSGSFELMLYDFEPASGVNIPKGTAVSFNFEDGTIQSFDDRGEVIWKADLIDTIKAVPHALT